MIVTREWLGQWRTPRGSWRKRQLEVLGVAWPTPRDWMRQVEGKEISEEDARLFEKRSGRTQHEVRAAAKTKAMVDAVDDGLGVPFVEGVFFIRMPVEQGKQSPPRIEREKLVKAFDAMTIVIGGLDERLEQKLIKSGIHGEVAAKAIQACHFAHRMKQSSAAFGGFNRMRLSKLSDLCFCLARTSAFNWGWTIVKEKNVLFLDTPHGIACWQSYHRFQGPDYKSAVPRFLMNTPVIVQWVEQILAWEDNLSTRSRNR